MFDGLQYIIEGGINDLSELNLPEPILPDIDFEAIVKEAEPYIEQAIREAEPLIKEALAELEPLVKEALAEAEKIFGSLVSSGVGIEQT